MAGDDDVLDNGTEEEIGMPGSMDDAYPMDAQEGSVTGLDDLGDDPAKSDLPQQEAAADRAQAEAEGRSGDAVEKPGDPPADGSQESRSLDGSDEDGFKKAGIEKPPARDDFNKPFDSDPPEDDDKAEDAAKAEAEAEAKPDGEVPEGVDERWAEVYKKDPEFAAEANRKVAAHEALLSRIGGENPNEVLEGLAANSRELVQGAMWRRQVGDALSEFKYRMGKGDVGGAMDLLGKELNVDKEHMMEFFSRRALARAAEADEPGSLERFDRSTAVAREDIEAFRRARALEEENARLQSQTSAAEGERWVDTLRTDPYVAEYNKRVGAKPGDLNPAAASIDRHVRARDPERPTAEEVRAAYDSWRREHRVLFGDLDGKAAAKPAAPAAKPAAAAAARPEAPAQRPKGLNPPSRRGQGGAGSKVPRKRSTGYFGVEEARAAHLKALREERARRLGAGAF